MTGDFNLYSAITVIDRQNLETILEQQGMSMTGYFSDDDFIRVGHLANARYVLAGSITRTATVYMLEFAVTDVQTGVRRASHPPTPVSIANLENLSAVREATAGLMGQLGVNLTARGRQQLTRAVEMADVQAQTALARGITAQRQGLEAEALSNFLLAGSHDPELAEAASRLNIITAGISRANIGAGAAQDIAWRRQWMDRLQQTEAFFVSYTQRQPYFLVYEPNIREGAINHLDETVELRFWMSLVPDAVWAGSVNRAILTVADSLRATGRAEAWGLDWPANHVGFVQPFGDRAGSLAVSMEIANRHGTVIGRQTVDMPTGYNIHSRISRAIVPIRWEGDVVFPGVEIDSITDRLTVRVAGINGVPAEEGARRYGVTVMSNEALFRAAGIRSVPADTSQFTVQADGTLSLWSGTGTEVDIPFMVNGVWVTAIGDRVFSQRGLTRVTIPDTVRSIGAYAFYGNRLAGVTIPVSVTTIGALAFAGVGSRTRHQSSGQLRSVNIPDSVTAIGHFAFAGNQLANVTIPGSVISIGYGSFRHNRLTSVTIGNGVTSIDRRAFFANELTSVTIPDSVRAMGDISFAMNQLASISIGANVDVHNITNWNCGFSNFYNQNGRRAGTYRLSGNTLTFTPR